MTKIDRLVKKQAKLKIKSDKIARELDKVERNISAERLYVCTIKEVELKGE